MIHIVLILLLATIAVSEDNYCTPKHLGCWADIPHNRAIAGGIRFDDMDNPVEKCYNFAKQEGYSVFAVQFNTQCFTSAYAADTYRKHGKSKVCYNGRGGYNAQDVYQVNCQGNVVNYYTYFWETTLVRGLRLMQNRLQTFAKYQDLLQKLTVSIFCQLLGYT